MRNSGTIVTPLTGKQRRYLRALAHDRKPLIQIGHSGLTPGVIEAIDSALVTHELIKVKVLAECPEDVDALAPKLEQATRASVAQTIGRTLVAYRRRTENPTIALPGAPAPKPRVKKASGKKPRKPSAKRQAAKRAAEGSRTEARPARGPQSAGTRRPTRTSEPRSAERASRGKPPPRGTRPQEGSRAPREAPAGRATSRGPQRPSSRDRRR